MLKINWTPDKVAKVCQELESWVIENNITSAEQVVTNVKHIPEAAGILAYIIGSIIKPEKQSPPYLKYEVIKQLDKNDWGSFHDTIFNASDNSTLDLTQEQLEAIFLNMPEELHLGVMKYGVSDTPTSEKIYQWYIENYI